MNNCRRSSWLITSSVASLALLTGCGGDEEAIPPPGQMVIIAGDRQGVPSMMNESGSDPEIVISSLRDQLLGRFDRDMTVSVIPADGAPQAAQTELYELDTDNPTQQKDSPEKRLEELSENLASLQAPAGEADVLGALDAGGRAAAGSEDKTLYIFDSGVSTAGPLAMQNGLLGPETDVSKIVEQLQATGNIPHITGVEVHWWGLGQVVSPQGNPPVWAKTKLQELWASVIEAGEGSVIFHNDAIQATAPTGEMPEVTPVDFNDIAAQPEPVSLTIPEQSVAFNPNEATFADAALAKETLNRVVETLRDSSVSDLWVTGCTANPDGASMEGMIDLSERRAQSVADALKTAGLSVNLIAKGLGPTCPGRVPETGNGAEVEAAQVKNRQVLITSKELSPVPAQG